MINYEINDFFEECDNPQAVVERLKKADSALEKYLNNETSREKLVDILSDIICYAYIEHEISPADYETIFYFVEDLAAAAGIESYEL